MIVINKDGELFDERRKKGERRNCKRREEDIKLEKKVDKVDRRKKERREENINKK